jgi:YspA, cpYpsA-related SLOG family
MRVLVCGGRDFSDAEWLFRELDRIHALTPISCIIEGGAAGLGKISPKVFGRFLNFGPAGLNSESLSIRQRFGIYAKWHKIKKAPKTELANNIRLAFAFLLGELHLRPVGAIALAWMRAMRAAMLPHLRPHRPLGIRDSGWRRTSIRASDQLGSICDGHASMIECAAALHICSMQACSNRRRRRRFALS